jgi:cAMP phosphodiesterase
MKVQLLPTSFERDGTASQRQHLSCLIIDDRVAVDAGSLAMAATSEHRAALRDIILTHAHLDHIAGLPLYVDDLFASLESPIRVFALKDVIDVLERDVFNWSVFPRFSELDNGRTTALEYRPIEIGEVFSTAGLKFKMFGANHGVPSGGLIVKDARSTIAVTGDTGDLADLSAVVKSEGDLSAVFIECAFPDELSAIAESSHHMTPSKLGSELVRVSPKCPVYIFNIKANYRERVVDQLEELNVARLEITEIGRVYSF